MHGYESSMHFRGKFMDFTEFYARSRLFYAHSLKSPTINQPKNTAGANLQCFLYPLDEVKLYS